MVLYILWKSNARWGEIIEANAKWVHGICYGSTVGYETMIDEDGEYKRLKDKNIANCIVVLYYVDKTADVDFRWSYKFNWYEQNW